MAWATMGVRRRAGRNVVLLLVLGSLIAYAGPSRARAAGDPADKIEFSVREALAASGQATFWVVLQEEANLAPAYGLLNHSERGSFVYRKLKGVATRSQAGLRRMLGARVGAFKEFWIVNTVRVTGDEALALEIAARPEVKRIVADRIYQLPPPEAGVLEPRVDAAEWNIERIRAPLAWSTFNVRGEGILIASIDTGVQYSHPALVRQYRGNLGGGRINHNYSWFDPSHICGNPSLAPCDNNGHGTHTMGTMVGDDGGANPIGVAPNAKWIAAKGCEHNSCSLAALLAAGQWVLAPTDLNGNNPRPDLRPHIVNNSWGGGGGDIFYAATVYAWVASGIFPAFANGNSGPGCGTSGSPGDYVASYSAGALDVNDNIASFSSRGPSLMGPGALKPNIAAPGVSIRSSVPFNGDASLSGTSMASPHVAGTVALVWSASSSIRRNVANTRLLLDYTAIDTPDLTCGGTAADNNVYGEGRLDAFAAVQLAPHRDAR